MPPKKSKDLSLVLPPQDLEAEKSVLGSVLIDHKSLIKISDLLLPEDFYDEKNQIIFETMLLLFEKRNPIDILTVSSNLEGREKLEIIGGRAYLVDLINSVPTATNILRYGQIVKEKSTLRKLVRVGEEIKMLGYDAESPLDENLERAEQKVFSISQNYLKGNFIHIKDVLNDTYERIADLHDWR